MKNINKLIFHYVFEIVIVLLFIVISVPIWDVLNKSEAAEIAKSYSNMDYLYMDIDKYVGHDNFEDKIAIINDTNTMREYKLLVKIDKNIKITNENIIVNNKIKELSSLKYKEDKKYVYYLINQGKIVASRDELDIHFENSNLKYYDVEYEIVEYKNI